MCCAVSVPLGFAEFSSLDRHHGPNAVLGPGVDSVTFLHCQSVRLCRLRAPAGSNRQGLCPSLRHALTQPALPGWLQNQRQLLQRSTQAQSKASWQNATLGSGKISAGKELRHGVLVCCSFDLDVLGGDVTLLPGLEAWLNSFLASSVLRSGLHTVRIMMTSYLCPICDIPILEHPISPCTEELRLCLHQIGQATSASVAGVGTGPTCCRTSMW